MSGQLSIVRNVGGRPTKFRPEYCEAVIEHCSSGASLTSFAGSIGASRRVLANWCERWPEFGEAVEIAKAKACGWWETQARKIVAGDGGPGASAIAVFALKNFGGADFADKREVAYSGGINHALMTYQEAIEEARRRGLPEMVLLAEPLERDGPDDEDAAEPGE